MAKLTEANKRQITIKYAQGSSMQSLAEKYTVSKSAIAKLLKTQKSVQKLTELNAVNQTLSKSLKSKAHKAIEIIIDGLPNDLKKANLKSKMTALERLTDLFGMPEDNTEDITEIVVKVVDGRADDDKRN